MRVDIRLANPKNRSLSADVSNVLVDTGATWTVIPRGLAQQLQLETLGQKTVRTANGPVMVDHSFAYIEYDGYETIQDVMIADTYPDVLLGSFTLEGMALAVDPKTGRLVDSELLLL